MDNLIFYQQVNGGINCGIFIQWKGTQQLKGMDYCYVQQQAWRKEPRWLPGHGCPFPFASLKHLFLLHLFNIPGPSTVQPSPVCPSLQSQQCAPLKQDSLIADSICSGPGSLQSVPHWASQAVALSILALLSSKAPYRKGRFPFQMSGIHLPEKGMGQMPPHAHG